ITLPAVHGRGASFGECYKDGGKCRTVEVSQPNTEKVELPVAVEDLVDRLMDLEPDLDAIGYLRRLVRKLEAMDATEAMIAAEIGIEEALMGAAREY
ncbi:MAG: hypothetical protein CYPHOPRED_002181, partial [Cyphobasidiales sp. Tagirdzhanova-0007]